MIRFESTTSEALRNDAAYCRRVGRLMQCPDAQQMYMSEALRIGRSWRTAFGFYLARALGWPRVYASKYPPRSAP